MAYISKIKMSPTSEALLLKDAEAQALLAGLGENVTVKQYVDTSVAGVKQFNYEIVTTLPTPSANTMYTIYLVADITAAAGTYLEYITVDNGASANPRYTNEQIGSTQVDLSGYVPTSRTIAGVNLEDNITSDELKTALGLGTMAEVNSATGSYTPEGTISASVTGTTATATITYSSYTPAGTISLDASAAPTAATLTTADYTPEGTISKPDVTVTATTTTISVNKTAGTVTVGTAASFTEGTFTPNVPTVINTTKFSGGSLGTATTGAFATAGITAEVGTGDDAETLIFTAASTSSAVTAQGTFTPAEIQSGFYTAGTAASKAADTFTAGTPTEVTLPTFEATTVMTGATAALAATPTFTGTTAADALVTGVSYDKTSVTGATFTGTAANIVASTINYEKATTVTATFTGTTATITVTPNTTEQYIK